jgi:hypothetical protein
MKIKLTSLYTMLLLAAPLWLNADPGKSQDHSAEFERLKTLAGIWKGQADIGEGPVEMTVQYRLLAGGSVLEERVFAGSPHEMVTMYFEKNGKLALTHYCMMGNRPGMLLKSSDAKTLRFEFDESCGIDPSTETHMNALTIRFDDADTVTATCKSMVAGKAVEGHPTTLKRVKLEKN